MDIALFTTSLTPIAPQIGSANPASSSGDNPVSSGTSQHIGESFYSINRLDDLTMAALLFLLSYFAKASYDKRYGFVAHPSA